MVQLSCLCLVGLLFIAYVRCITADVTSTLIVEKMICREYNCSLFTSTRRNGSLYVHTMLYPNKPALKDSYMMTISTSVTDYKIPVSYFQLLKDSNQKVRRLLIP